MTASASRSNRYSGVVLNTNAVLHSVVWVYSSKACVAQADAQNLTGRSTRHTNYERDTSHKPKPSEAPRGATINAGRSPSTGRPTAADTRPAPANTPALLLALLTDVEDESNAGARVENALGALRGWDFWGWKRSSYQLPSHTTSCLLLGENPSGLLY